MALAAKPATAILGRFLAAIHRRQRRLGLNNRFAVPLAGSVCVTRRAPGELVRVLLVATVRSAGRHRSGVAATRSRRGQDLRNGAGVARVPSVPPEPARRLDAVQFGKIKGANRLQPVSKRGLPEIVGQVVEPRLVLPLEVEQGAYRILPELRSRVAVLRPAVMQAWLLCLAAFTIAPLSLGVGQSHGHCAPLRNGSGGYGSGLVSGVGLRSRYAAAGGGRAVGRSTR